MVSFGALTPVHRLQESVRDVQQLQDAHVRYLETCRGACWLQGAPGILAAIRGLVQGCSSLVDCLAAEG